MVIRVLQVVTHMNRGGLETMLMNYYRKIDKSKVQFDFLVHRRYRAHYDDEIESLGGRIYRLPKLNPWSKTYRKSLNEFFSEHQEYQIIHVHQDCMSSVILKAAEKNGIQVRIAHSHNSNQDKNIKYPIKMYYRYFIPKYATHLFACGDKAGEWMYRGAKYEVINNAIATQDYTFNKDKRTEVRQMLGIDENIMLIGHVGRFSYPKNHDFLVWVFSEIVKDKAAKLLLVGDGELRVEIEKKIKELNLEEKVIFTGVRDDVADLLQAMDVFVFPSLYEGFPVTIVEAQASGLPCLISEKVPIECKMTNLVYQLPLNSSIKCWVDEIIKLSKFTRKNTYDDIKRAGFDIEESVNRLQKKYLEAYSNIK